MPVSNATFVARTEHEIKSIPGFSLHMIKLDILHVLDQGVTSHVIGNVLCEMLQPDFTIRQLNTEMYEWYSQQRQPAPVREIQ